MTKSDDLIRRGDALAEVLKRHWPQSVGAARAIRALPAALQARLAEVEAELRFHVDDAVKAWNAREAAEARLAEVEAERDAWQRQWQQATNDYLAKCKDLDAMETRAEVAEARLAEVEAERDLHKAKREKSEAVLANITLEWEAAEAALKSYPPRS